MTHQVIFYVEGYAEMEFVNEIIGPHLADLGIVWHRPILVASSVRKDRISRGGVRKYGPIKNDLERLLAQYGGAGFIFTTLLDYYGLPDDFPGGKAPGPGVLTPLEKSRAMEQAWKDELGDHRFLPNLLLHEYEALILSRPKSLLAGYPGAKAAIQELEQEIWGFQTPEDINDNILTAPSKRIMRIFEKHHLHYDKVTGGALAILELGLETVRRQCAKFDEWVKKLESLAER